MGSVRVGVARSDADALLAVPESTLGRDSALGGLAALADETDPVCAYVGFPLSLDGTPGHAADLAEAFARELAARLPQCPVRLVDERLSTVEAQRALHAAGRTAKSSRSVVDQVAATLILEHALAAERASGTWAGRRVTVDVGHDRGREDDS